MTVDATAQRRVEAPRETVWQVLDDFPNISAWSAGILNSYSTGDGIATGLGAERRCELGGKKVLDERITDYRDGESITIHVHNVEGLPLNESITTFSVTAGAENTSVVSVHAEASPKLPGVLVSLMRPLIARGLSKNLGGLLDELAAAAEQRVRS